MPSGVVTMGPGAAVGASAVVIGGVIGGMAQSSVQLATKGVKPFSYTDALIALGTGAVTQGGGFMAQEAINIGGAHLGSSIKDESAVGPMVGAAFGTAVGPLGKTAVKDKLSPFINKNAAESRGAVAGFMVGQAVDHEIQQQINNKCK